MKIKNGVITEATEMELYKHWLDSDFFEVYDFKKYLELCKQNGTCLI